MKHFEKMMQKHGLTLDTIDWNAPYMAELNAARDRDVHEEEVIGLRNERQVEWEAICPFEYRVTDLKQLLTLSPKAKDIISFPPNGRSLIVNGPSRRGKTRAVWLLLRRVFIEHNVNFEWMTASQFSDRAIQASKNDGLDGFLVPLIKCPLVFIDDLGVSKITPKVAEALYDIVEGRTSRKKPILFTTNLTRDTLATSFEDPTASVRIVSRMLEFSHVITL